MQKRILTLFLLSFIILLLPVCGFADDKNDLKSISPAVIINSKPIQFTAEKPFISEDTTLVPLRDIFSALGAQVFWYGKTNSVIATKNSDMIELQIGNSFAKKNNKEVLLTKPALLKENQTFVPLRFVAESFDADVSYDAYLKQVIINTKPSGAQNEKSADEKFALLSGGESILTSESFKSCSIRSNGVSYSFKDGIAFADVSENFENPYNCQFCFTLKDFGFKKGDIMLCSFKVRALSCEDSKARIGLVHEQNFGSYKKSVSQEYSIVPDGKWNTIYLPYNATMDFEKGKSQFNIRLGYLKQNIEIKDFALTRYNNLSFSDLPSCSSSYEGREESSDWRKSVMADIEKNRKSDIVISVTDSNSNPIPDAEVTVEMTNHEFDFGTAVKADYINSSDEKYDDYKKYLSLFFNSAVLENALKRPNFQANPQRALDALDKLNEMGFKDLRAHTMVWDREDKLPESFNGYKTSNPQKMEDETLLHIKNIGSATLGKVSDWDVANEVLQNRYMRDVLGDMTLVKWFKEAKKADPNAVLYLNENTVTTIKSPNAQKFYDFVKHAKQLGAPIEGIGLQCHFNSAADMSDFTELLDYYSTLGCDIKITEFDFQCPDKELQADFTKDIILACYSRPNVKGFMMWGFTDSAHWENDAPLFYKDYTLKPSGAAYIKTVFDTLWTNESGKTNENGNFSLRGFYGDYKITVKKDGKTYTSYQNLSKNTDNTFKVIINDN